MKIIVQLLSRCTDEQTYNKHVQTLRSLSVSITATCADIKQLADFLNCNMVYFLTSTDIFKPAIYVGRAGKRTETGDTFLERLKEHVNLTTNRDKEMAGQWDKIQFIVQSDDDISKDVMERLEAIFIEEAFRQQTSTENGQDDLIISYKVLNHKPEGEKPLPRGKPEDMEYCIKLVDRIKSLLADDGCSAFKSVTETASSILNRQTLNQLTDMQKKMDELQRQYDELCHQKWHESQQAASTSSNININNTDSNIINKVKIPERIVRKEVVCEKATPQAVVDKQLSLIDWSTVTNETTFLNLGCKNGIYLLTLAYKLFTIEKLHGYYKDYGPDENKMILDNIFNNQLFGITTSPEALTASRFNVYQLDTGKILTDADHIRYIPYFSEFLINHKYNEWLTAVTQPETVDINYQKYFSKFKTVNDLYAWALDRTMRSMGKTCTYAQAKKDVENILQSRGQEARDLRETAEKYVVLEIVKKELGRNMFDVVIGNPPYQDAKRVGQIYQNFMELGLDMTDKVETMITESSWLNRDSLAQTRDRIIRNGLTDIISYPIVSDVFKDAGIAVAIFKVDKQYRNKDIETNFVEIRKDKVVATSKKQFHEGEVLVEGIMDAIGKKVMNVNDRLNNGSLFSERIQTWKLYDLPTDTYIKKADVLHDERQSENDLKVYHMASLKPRVSYIDIKYIKPQSVLTVNKYKVICGRILHANSNVVTSIKILKPGEVCNESYGVLAVTDTLDEAMTIGKYVLTKFFRFMCLYKIGKGTNGWSASRFTMVPDIAIDKNGQDISSNMSNGNGVKIDWSKTIDQIDEQLYKKYNLTDDEKEYIKGKIDYYTKK